MPLERRYYIARVTDPKKSLHYILLPEKNEHSIQQALEMIELARSWFFQHPNEVERFALVLREFGHHLAGILEEAFPELSVIGIDTIQGLFSHRELRLHIATQIGPSRKSKICGGNCLGKGGRSSSSSAPCLPCTN
jgi:hypothetical protein